MSTAQLLMPDSFTRRDLSHQAALRLCDQIFSEYDATAVQTGVEQLYQPDIREVLYAQDDRTSRRIRHSPDRLYLFRGQCAVHAEIKSESGSSNNYAMDIDSHDAVLALDGMYVFSDRSGRIDACWARQVEVDCIHLAEQLADFAEQRNRLAIEWPRAQVRPCRPTRGSRHPFILIPKHAHYLIPLGQFIERELLR